MCAVDREAPELIPLHFGLVWRAAFAPAHTGRPGCDRQRRRSHRGAARGPARRAGRRRRSGGAMAARCPPAAPAVRSGSGALPGTGRRPYGGRRHRVGICRRPKPRGCDGSPVCEHALTLIFESAVAPRRPLAKGAGGRTFPARPSAGRARGHRPAAAKRKRSAGHRRPRALRNGGKGRRAGAEACGRGRRRVQARATHASSVAGRVGLRPRRRGDPQRSQPCRGDWRAAGGPQEDAPGCCCGWRAQRPPPPLSLPLPPPTGWAARTADQATTATLHPPCCRLLRWRRLPRQQRSRRIRRRLRHSPPRRCRSSPPRHRFG